MSNNAQVTASVHRMEDTSTTPNTNEYCTNLIHALFHVTNSIHQLLNTKSNATVQLHSKTARICLINQLHIPGLTEAHKVLRGKTFKKTLQNIIQKWATVVILVRSCYTVPKSNSEEENE